MKMQYLQYGSPTAELFVASYNNRKNKTKTITLGVVGNGYTQNSREGWLKVEENYGIYIKSTSWGWNWSLASPWYFEGYKYEFSVSYYGACTGTAVSHVYNGHNTVRPIVCIPTSVFNSKYGTEANLVDE